MDTPSPSTASTTAHAVGYNDEPSITAAPLRSTDDLAVDAGQLSSLILTTEATATPQRIVESVTSLTSSGILAEGQRMPTVRDLADCYAPVRPPSPVPTMPSPGPAYCAPAGAPEHSYCGSRARIATMPATCWPKPRPPRRTDRLSTCPRARRTFRCCRTSARFSASSARTRHSSIHTTGRPSCPCWNRFCDATGRMSRRR